MGVLCERSILMTTPKDEWFTGAFHEALQPTAKRKGDQHKPPTPERHLEKNKSHKNILEV